ncbi:MAG: CCA tRNA nucleotidyltransferase [Asticcacaulis sp.]
MTRLAETTDFLNDPRTDRVMAALEAAGGSDCARFVGGAVRNALMGLSVEDVDIATQLDPAAVLAALEAAGLKAIPTGIEHGTVTAVCEGRPFEITTLRRDVETDGRRAVVAFSRDWREDALRRDFRLNALYADRAGCVFDPVEGGLADLEARRVVFVGDPHQRIQEDALRILRFFRFHAGYGAGDPDPAGLEACLALRDRVADLSGERLQKELLKTLAAPGVMSVLIPLLACLERVVPVADLSVEGAAASFALEPDPVARLALLILANRDAVEAACARLRLARAHQAVLMAGVNPDLSEGAALSDPRALRAAAYRLGKPVVRLALARSLLTDPVGFGARRAALEALESWSVPVFGLRGRDVKALSNLSGNQIGLALKSLEQRWIAADFPAWDFRAELRAYIDTETPCEPEA